MSPIRPLAFAVLALAAVGLAAGCGTLSWYGDAAIGQMRILAARRDVADVLADPRTAPETAANLQRVEGILAFAEQYLRLETGRRYRTYVALERDTLAWNVFAAPEFSLNAHRWCYPIVGCAAYRGFFDPDKARREAETLATRGFDVHIGRVAAYSTLGWFDDPLVSTFIDYSDERLAELLFHELAHGALFVPGDSSFNEAFATFVGREGALEWLRAQGRDTAPYVASKRASARLARFLGAWRERLQAMYAEPLAEDQRRLLKAALLQAMRDCYAERPEHLGARFDGYMSRPFNNARLAAFGAYEDRTGAFAALFARADRNWQAFFRAARNLAAQEPGTRAEAMRTLRAAHGPHEDGESAQALLCQPSPDASPSSWRDLAVALEVSLARNFYGASSWRDLAVALEVSLARNFYGASSRHAPSS